MKNISIFQKIKSVKKALFIGYFVLFGLILTASPMHAMAFSFEDFFDPIGIFHDTDGKDPLDIFVDNVLDPADLFHDSGTDDSGQDVAVSNTAPTLAVSCYVSPTSAIVGQTVYWNSSVSGGNGGYVYTWSGTDGLSGHSNSVSRAYSVAGIKTASVVVTSSDGQTVTRSCTNRVTVTNGQGNYGNLDVSCYTNPTTMAVGETVNWNASASGGNGGYGYSWSGTDNLYGSSNIISRAYNTTGTKTASVTVTSSDGQTITRSCNSAVNITDQGGQGGYGNLDASCYVSPSSASTGQIVYWNTSATGGDGTYTYYWSGTDGFSGSNRSMNKVYYTPGYKTATVSIYSGGQTITRSCSMNIYGDNYNNNYNNYNETPLQVSCSPNSTSVGVGQNMTWSSNVYGGNGNYQYYWSGTDGISGSNSTMTRSYVNPGSKSASLTVISGNQTIVRTCSNGVSVGYVGTTYNSGSLRASCYANRDTAVLGQAVTWSTLVAGGTGNYAYSWSGTESLYGSSVSVSKSYGDTGIKYATVTVTSNGQSVTSPCVNTTLVSVPRAVTPAVVRPVVTPPPATPITPAVVTNDNDGLLGTSFFGISNFPLILFFILIILILIGLVVYLLYYRDRQVYDRHDLIVGSRDGNTSGNQNGQINR